ncbi:aspartate aminotransferase family protein [Lentibacillus salinarum]|uniref:Aspartate aminotransferase family protein n=1 Tax=Lentibacillus salinarum TaxID=446820 RepID=A0ABW3ZTJ7_9BACI
MGLYKDVYKKDVETYINKTPESKNKYEIANNYMPGGETRSVCFHKPYPLTIEEARGAYLYDIDGNRYIDFLNNYTSMVHGHAHEHIAEKAQFALKKGTAYAATIPEKIQFSELLCNRVPSIKKIRFCNSGTEATMFAIRAACTFTKKTSIIKMDGAYHGTHDLAAWDSRYNTAVFPKNISQNIYVAPFNDSETIEQILSLHADDIAAILVEPVMGVAGVIPPNEGYLDKLRKLADKYQVLLIFDEVQTLRLDIGGAQEMYGVTPDLTCMAKIIGGGFPVGAFGGKKEIMNMFDPSKDGFLAHGGTFNGNKVTLSAGIATMQLLDIDKIEKMNSLSIELENKIKKTVKQSNIPVTLTRVGSMMNIHFTENKPENYAETLHSNKELIDILHIKLLNRGIFIAPRGLINLSTVMTQQNIQEAGDVFKDALQEMMPLLDR